MKTVQNSHQKTSKFSRLTSFFRKLTGKIANLFELEEVEVTFKNKGGHEHYTYRVIDHKHAA